jgi:hypothetical protein
MWNVLLVKTQPNCNCKKFYFSSGVLDTSADGFTKIIGFCVDHSNNMKVITEVIK